MPLTYQPAPRVLALSMDCTNRTAIVVMRARGDCDALTQHLALERITRLHAARLADFRRINTLESHFQGLLAGAGFDPQRIAIDDPRDDARLRLKRGGCSLSDHQDKQYQQHYRY